MLARSTSVTAAIAVVYAATAFIGCATPRMIDELKADVRRLETQNQQTQQMLARLDSSAAEQAEANRRLGHEMSVTVGELQQQIAALLENNNDLLQRVERMAQRLPTVSTLRSSPGAEVPSQIPGQQEPAIDCDRAYDESFVLFRRYEYEQAIEGFRQFMSQCEKHDLVENARYWVGECYYSMEKYEPAIEEFEYLLNSYKSSVNASRALYKLGRSMQELGKTSDAKKTFQRLVDEFPGTVEAEQAKERLKDLK